MAALVWCCSTRRQKSNRSFAEEFVRRRNSLQYNLPHSPGSLFVSAGFPLLLDAAAMDRSQITQAAMDKGNGLWTSNGAARLLR